MKIIYCDGSSLGNPGPGGWGVFAMDTEKNKVWEFGGGEKTATNNQMELQAAIFALRLISKSDSKKFEMRLDSKYVIQGSTLWVQNWVKNNWKNSQKKEVLNKEKWQEILKLLAEIKNKNIKIKWTHVFGHTGETGNERVDEIAKLYAQGKSL